MAPSEKDIADEIRRTLAQYKNRGTPARNKVTGQRYVSLRFPIPGMRSRKMKITLPDQDFAQPSAIFEKKYGLAGISHQYKLPQALAATDIESYVVLLDNDRRVSNAESREKIAAVWRELKKLNPELRGLHDEKKNAAQTQFYILGVTSAFNPDDIRYFCRLHAVDKAPFLTMRESHRYKKLTPIFNKHAARLSNDIAWAAAPKTLERIEKQVRAENRKVKAN